MTGAAGVITATVPTRRDGTGATQDGVTVTALVTAPVTVTATVTAPATRISTIRPVGRGGPASDLSVDAARDGHR